MGEDPTGQRKPRGPPDAPWGLAPTARLRSFGHGEAVWSPAAGERGGDDAIATVGRARERETRVVAFAAVVILAELLAVGAFEAEVRVELVAHQVDDVGL